MDEIWQWICQLGGGGDFVGPFRVKYTRTGRIKFVNLVSDQYG